MSNDCMVYIIFICASFVSAIFLCASSVNAIFMNQIVSHICIPICSISIYFISLCVTSVCVIYMRVISIRVIFVYVKSICVICMCHIYGLDQHYTAFFSSECLEMRVKDCALIRSILTYCQNRSGYILTI